MLLKVLEEYIGIEGIVEIMEGILLLEGVLLWYISLKEKEKLKKLRN